MRCLTSFRLLPYSALLALAATACKDDKPKPASGAHTPVVTQSSAEDIALGDNLYIDKSMHFAYLVIPKATYDGYILSGEYFGEVDGKRSLSWLITDVEKHIRVNDNFDFQTLITPEEKNTRTTAGELLTINFNRIKGIGNEKISDPNPLNHRLLGIAKFSCYTFLKEGPILHEIMHAFNHSFLTDQNDMAAGDGSHWGYSSVGGQLGGWYALENPSPQDGNVYTAKDYEWEQYKLRPFTSICFNPNNGLNTIQPYANLELYLMGLIPATELKPVQVAINGRPHPGVSCIAFEADGMYELIPQKMLAINGNRDPAYPHAPTSFRMLFTVLTYDPAAQLTTQKRAQILQEIDNFTAKGDPVDWIKENPHRIFNFWNATLQKASMDALIAPENLLQ